eukprot:TRINITY_DN61628_c0_g1_i1.p1 TRINITY_DN61628_c0_g1~~TRINITY_DN61628_c0_g1_i1.p1  ORF type:complete len:211 (-),score=43.04 TRINITY_DN61628_c0_g1_i1:3-635(-)
MIRRPPRSTLSSSSAASDVYKRQVQGRPTRPFEESSPKRPSPNHRHQHQSHMGNNGYRGGGYGYEEGSSNGGSMAQEDQSQFDEENDDAMMSVVMMEGYYNPIKSKYGLTARDLMKKREQCAGKKIRFSSNVPTSLEERREAVVDFVRSMMISNQQTVQEIEERENARIQQRDDELATRNPPMRYINEVSLTPDKKLVIGLRAKEHFERQ